MIIGKEVVQATLIQKRKKSFPTSHCVINKEKNGIHAGPGSEGEILISRKEDSTSDKNKIIICSAEQYSKGDRLLDINLSFSKTNIKIIPGTNKLG